MDEMPELLQRWQLDVKAVREQMYRAPTPRERERWHAIWLLARGFSPTQVAEAFERDVRTIDDWLDDLRQKGPAALAFEQTGGSPPPSTHRTKRR